MADDSATPPPETLALPLPGRTTLPLSGRTTLPLSRPATATTLPLPGPTETSALPVPTTPAATAIPLLRALLLAAKSADPVMSMPMEKKLHSLGLPPSLQPNHLSCRRSAQQQLTGEREVALQHSSSEPQPQYRRQRRPADTAFASPHGAPELPPRRRRRRQIWRKSEPPPPDLEKIGAAAAASVS
jgi:hypothetical protein